MGFCSVSYLAQLVRYGERQDEGIVFAMPLKARAGTTQSIAGFISNELNAANWIEIVNTGTQKTTVKISCYKPDGQTVLTSSNTTLNPHAQYHMDGAKLLRFYKFQQ